MLLTPEEVCDRYRGVVSPRTPANWRSQGVGPRWVKIGKAVLYPVEKLTEWEQRGNKRERPAKAG